MVLSGGLPFAARAGRERDAYRAKACGAPASVRPERRRVPDTLAENSQVLRTPNYGGGRPSRRVFQFRVPRLGVFE